MISDRFLDYVPLVSTLTNLFHLFQKYVVLRSIEKKSAHINHYYNHLDQKSTSRCVLLLVPFLGNISVAIYDFANRKYNDENFMLDAIRKNYSVLRHASKRLKSSKEFMLGAISSPLRFSPSIFSREVVDHEDIVKSIREDNKKLETILYYASDQLKNDREFMISITRAHRVYNRELGRIFYTASKRVKNDKELILDAVKEDSKRLETVFYYASDQLKNEKFVLDAISEDSKRWEAIFHYASFQLEHDEPPVLNATDQLEHHRKLALNIIKADIWAESIRLRTALYYASDQLKNDKEFMINFIRAETRRLKIILDNADRQLKNDKKFVLNTIREGSRRLETILDYKNDKKFVLNTIWVDIWAESIRLKAIFCYASDQLKNSTKFVLEAIRESSKRWETILDHASDQLKNDTKFMLEAIWADIWANNSRRRVIFNHAGNRVKDDAYLLNSAIWEDIWTNSMKSKPSLSHASKWVINDKEFILNCIESIQGKKWNRVDEMLILNYMQPIQSDRWIGISQSLLLFGRMIRHISNHVGWEIKNDQDIVLKIINQIVQLTNYKAGFFRYRVVGSLEGINQIRFAVDCFSGSKLNQNEKFITLAIEKILHIFNSTNMYDFKSRKRRMHFVQTTLKTIYVFDVNIMSVIRSVDLNLLSKFSLWIHNRGDLLSELYEVKAKEASLPDLPEPEWLKIPPFTIIMLPDPKLVSRKYLDGYLKNLPAFLFMMIYRIYSDILHNIKENKCCKNLLYRYIARTVCDFLPLNDAMQLAIVDNNVRKHLWGSRQDFQKKTSARAMASFKLVLDVLNSTMKRTQNPKLIGNVLAGFKDLEKDLLENIYRRRLNLQKSRRIWSD
ncbi:MAG: DUF4116 domain-containing protein [Chlamydiota bacterium]